MTDNKMTAEQALGTAEAFATWCHEYGLWYRSDFTEQAETDCNAAFLAGYNQALSAPRVPMATDAMIYRGAEWLHDHGMRIDGDPIDAAEQMEKIAEGVFEAMLTASPEPVAPAAGGSWEEETHS